MESFSVQYSNYLYAAAYYPFGMQMPGATHNYGSGYRWGYQGQYAKRDSENEGLRYFPITIAATKGFVGSIIKSANPALWVKDAKQILNTIVDVQSSFLMGIDAVRELLGNDKNASSAHQLGVFLSNALVDFAFTPILVLV